MMPVSYNSHTKNNIRLILTNKYIFNLDHDVTYKKIMKVDYKLPPHISKAAAHLISKLLVFHPTLRMTLEQVNTHPWFLSNK